MHYGIRKNCQKVYLFVALSCQKHIIKMKIVRKL